nr:PREDICTED: protein phosphatase 1 regulatory subunit 1A [Latimeria chalumnae]|eukprot:XP_006006703.2 PREDICTED: protein phosphatase 1 regulatory subunit 1A [Latimeria chalumnae]
MSPRQKKKAPGGTPTMKELQFLLDNHLCKQTQEMEDGSTSRDSLSDKPSPECCHGNSDPSHSREDGALCQCIAQDCSSSHIRMRQNSEDSQTSGKPESENHITSCKHDCDTNKCYLVGCRTEEQSANALTDSITAQKDLREQTGEINTDTPAIPGKD